MAVTYSNTYADIGATTTAVLAAREDRVYAILTNDDDESMYLGINAAAVMNSGIRLSPGEKLLLEPQDLLNVAINAICASGSKNMAIFEMYK
jgi:hypothetical protein